MLLHRYTVSVILFAVGSHFTIVDQFLTTYLLVSMLCDATLLIL